MASKSTPSSRNVASPARSLSSDVRQVKPLALGLLEFDLSNPRYGTQADKFKTERDALNHIVKTFGVADVLGSIAVNGFFDSEPLVGIRQADGKVKIYEGNRRLAACLILTGEERAVEHNKLRKQYLPIYREHGSKPIDRVPVIVYEGEKAMQEILPYIGVRHIVGFLEWDSYAKAEWIDKALRNHRMSIGEVQQMVGDKNDTIRRMLSGHRFVNQLIREGRFRPEQSQRRGRGSNLGYPFSWVYTLLLNTQAKEFVALKETPEGVADENPVPENKLEDAAWLMTFMFGNRDKGIAAVVEDSRELGDLAVAIKNPLLYSKLKSGTKLRVVVEEGRPSNDRLRDGLDRIETLLKEMTGLIIPGSLDAQNALDLCKQAQNVENLSRKITRDLNAIAHGEIEEE